jgi:hypothetical protein
MDPLAAAAVPAAALTAGLLTLYADWRPWAAPLLALHLVWLLVRPEIVRVSAPVLALVVLVQRPASSWAQSAAVVLVLAAAWAAVLPRLRARARQRAAAREAAEGVTAPLPDADRPVARGRFLTGVGLVVLALGAVVLVTPDPGDPAEVRHVVPAIGWLLVGLGLTVLLSALLGRHRATRLRRAPAPVLRVLVRENAEGDTEVFASDDVAALRPLFTVPVTEVYEDGEHDEAEDDRDDDDDDDEELEALLARIDSDEPGPLREAVLYGTPWDGAEILLVTAAGEPDEPPVVKRSSGPVRPLPEGTLRRRLAAHGRKAARQAAYAERARAAAEAVTGQPAGAVRRWHAGWLDRLVVLALVAWGTSQIWGETGVSRYGAGAVLGLLGAALLPHMAAWSVTADSEGLWLSGFRRTHHIAWDHIRVVRCKGTELKLDSKRAAFPVWTVDAPRWPWLERRLGLLHPYERTAAEITAIWHEPARRPTGTSRAGQRGRRPLWPLGVLFTVAWTAALVLLP